MTAGEPQSANDYDDRTTAAVKSVLIEIGQILGSYKGRYAVVGGAVPWLLLNQNDMRHVGTLDVDLSLDAAALGGGEYAHLIESLKSHGYEQRESLRRFQLVRQIDARDGGPLIDVIVDFLRPRDAVTAKNDPPLVDNFAVQRASGAELALRFCEFIPISGAMPNGGTNRVEVAVCSIPALLAMKGHAIHGRYKHKDAYTSTTASVTTLAALTRWLQPAGHCLITRRASPDTDSLPGSLILPMDSDPPASGGSLRKAGRWGNALRTSGSLTPLDRCMHGCAR
ncbi:hypothetical protein SAMN05421547_101290 [Delftia lacustris]|uniref:Nucleotidyl transferase AbiEii toxin, Type IV TA system n=1 Tax=Delftia lacustris TaxID=558537 RepID=A0A1H3EQ03_9BURK|nr:hypothetical protein SAMN05421547_101290 [Delftia lacustris]